VVAVVSSDDTSKWPTMVVAVVSSDDTSKWPTSKQSNNQPWQWKEVMALQANDQQLKRNSNNPAKVVIVAAVSGDCNSNGNG